MVARARRIDPVSAALVVGPILVFAVMAWRLRWTHDDGFITLRVVDQVFAGNGPVYNQGQRVEAFTSPLHVGLLVVARALFGWALDQAWLGLIITLVSAVAGLSASAAGAARLARAGGARRRLVPFGLLVPVAIPPMWEYATAGLETGIAIGWVGISFWLVALVVTSGIERRLWLVAAFVGLGPLVRPELALFSVALLAVLLTSAAVRGERKLRLTMLAAALALPVAYQVFRMGYYATLVPNTALAKEASGSRWGQGWYYLTNFTSPYLVVVPLLAFAAWLGFGRRRSLTRSFGGPDGRNLVAAMLAAAVAQTMYVVRVGGDYMHGRMLLIPMFALCCPLAVVAVPKAQQARTVVSACVAGTAIWAAFVGLSRRAPLPEGFFGSRAVAEQRPFFTSYAGNPHPVTLDDWRASFLWQAGDEARRAHAADRDVLLNHVEYPGITLGRETPLDAGRGTFLFIDGIGVASARAGVDVDVIDLHGLADPLSSRMPSLVPRGLPGHEKVLPEAWALAEAGQSQVSEAAADAVVATGCGDLQRLLAAIRGPLTPGRFVRNVAASPGFTRLVLPKDPAEASACARVGR